MKIWEMKHREGSLVGYVPNEKLLRAITLCASNPSSVRCILDVAELNPVSMQLLKPLEAAVEQGRQQIPDVVFWSWMAIFSDRAAAAAIELGSRPNDFWPCQFQNNPEEKFFFCLPTKSVDLVDVDRSTFRHVMPLAVPMPIFFERLATKPVTGELPPCFWADRPNTNLVFHEFLIRDDFKLAWERLGLTGAEFRLLTT